jgi:hypothetical protein
MRYQFAFPLEEDRIGLDKYPMNGIYCRKELEPKADLTAFLSHISRPMKWIVGIFYVHRNFLISINL